MPIALKLLASYWKDIAMAIIVGFLVYVVFAWWGSNAEISRLNLTISNQTKSIELLQLQVASYQEAAKDLKENVETASRERKNIAILLSKEINKIKNQQIPKDCNKAIEYGIKNKGDLQWPGQQ